MNASNINVSDHRSVLFINWYDHLDPKAGGAELVLWELAKRLRRSGSQVTILVRRPDGASRREIIDGCQIIRTARNELIAMSVSILLYMFRLRRRHQIVIEFVNKIPFMMPLLRPGSHVVFQHHFNSEIWIEEFGKIGHVGRLIERWLFRTFYRRRNWVVVSQSTRDELSELGLKADSVSIVTNGSDHIEGRNSAAKSGHPTALVVSRLRRYKSVDVVIRAWKAVESHLPDAELIIAGTGPHEAVCRGLIADLNLKHVRILGHVSPERREELMATSWVTLQPSLKEGWGLTVMEAARFATPSIASDVPGLRDSIVPDETGVLVPHGDLAAWSAAILELLSNPERCQVLGRNARTRSDRYTWQAASDAFAEAIRAATAPET